MRADLSKILVTGGAGFIGSAFVRLGLKERGLFKLTVVDNLSYAGDLRRLAGVRKKIKFYRADIRNKKSVDTILRKENPDILVNFAAETHVDRSIRNAKAFIETNFCGIQVLLDASRKHGVKKFIQISTDEVYGQITKGSFTEESPLKPNSPYAASKAAADLLIRSYVNTYDFPAIIIRPSNNYGPWQYPEKLIPLSILKCLRNEKIPVYAQGTNVREWLFVEDCARGILKAISYGKTGQIYNLGSTEELRNIQVVTTLLKRLHKDQEMIAFVKDRPGHDFRYSLDSQKASRELKWAPRVHFKEGISYVVKWCILNQKWLKDKWIHIQPLYENR